MTSGHASMPFAPAMPAGRSSVRWCWRLCFAALCAWLAAAAWLVNVESGDGYSVLANAHYFVGEGGAYFWQRGPLMAWLLMPAEWLAHRLALAPLDVRPHHAGMALLHAGYLYWTWRMLVHEHAALPATLLAWLAAIPTLVFFGYAPFISHDILPGAALLQLCWLAHRHALQPQLGSALAFGALAVALALLKQTYAMAPAAVLLARLCALLSTRQLDAAQWRAGLQLAGMTLLAGVLCWAVYGALAGARFPEYAWWQRPLHIVADIANAYPPEVDLRKLFYRWLYLRNASAYGIAAMTLLLPALWLAWRSGQVWRRQLALCWLLLFAIMAWTPFKEVRYLAYLAPLSASLLVPVCAYALRRGPAWALGLAAVLLVDLARVVPEALRIRAPWYQEGVTRYFEPLAEDALADRPIFFAAGWLSFLAPDRTAFYADPFHRIVEMHQEQVRQLYGLPRERVFRLRLEKLAEALRLSPEGSVFMVQTRFISRVAPYGSDSRLGLWTDFQQFYARSTELSFVRREGMYHAPPDVAGPLLLVGEPREGSLMLRRLQGPLSASELRAYLGFDGEPAQLRVRALRLLRECTLDGCVRSGEPAAPRTPAPGAG